MSEDMERKRARDLARYHERRAAGTLQRSRPTTPEQLAKAAARQERALQWREVKRAFERVLRLEPAVFTEAKRRVDLAMPHTSIRDDTPGETDG